MVVMALFINGLVLKPLNRMALLSGSTNTSLMWLGLFHFKLTFPIIFGILPFNIPFILSIEFLHLSFKTSLHMKFSITNLLFCFTSKHLVVFAMHLPYILIGQSLIIGLERLFFLVTKRESKDIFFMIYFLISYSFLEMLFSMSCIFLFIISRHLLHQVPLYLKFHP